jgi:hypothetical protein
MVSWFGDGDKVRCLFATRNIDVDYFRAILWAAAGAALSRREAI